MIVGKFYFPGSHQWGRVIRSGMPLDESWRYIRRVGTRENLRKVASFYQVDPSVTDAASLRIRQAIELRESCRNTSILTKPIPLYYSALNLTRGILLPVLGEMGGGDHGLTYKEAASVLDCTATIKKRGTFPKLLDLQKVSDWDDYSKKTFSFAHTLRLIPELIHESSLVTTRSRLIAVVRVEAYIEGTISLTFQNTELTSDEFIEKWPSLFPWFSQDFEYESEFRITSKAVFSTEEAVSHFCHSKLLRDLMSRPDATWFDHISRDAEVLLPRLHAYVAGLFILSNISRYTPELLANLDPSSDLYFVIESFLTNAERALPLIVIEQLEGPTYFS